MNRSDEVSEDEDLYSSKSIVILRDCEKVNKEEY